jgi:hypothetical protein
MKPKEPKEPKYKEYFYIAPFLFMIAGYLVITGLVRVFYDVNSGIFGFIMFALYLLMGMNLYQYWPFSEEQKLILRGTDETSQG